MLLKTPHGPSKLLLNVLPLVKPQPAAHAKGTAHYDRDLKRKIYAQAGVKELWLIDPEAKQIQVHQLNLPTNKTPTLHGSDAGFNTPLLPGLLISAKAVFRPSRLG